MNKSELLAMGIDYDDAMDRFMNNEEFYMNMLTQFKNDPSYQLLLEAIDNNNVEAAFNAAHDLKSMTGNLSMKSLYKHVCLLVNDLRKGDMSHIDKLLPPVIDEYTTIISMLK